MDIIVNKNIPDIKIFSPKKFGDNRGFFSETYNKVELQKLGVSLDFVQDNQSLSTEAYTLRGLHFQSPPYAQDKLVRILKGSALDVAVDIRKNSPTYGKFISVKLSVEEFNQILVPIGFAHGIVTLEPNTEIFYKVTNHFSKEHDHGIAWNDPTLNIDWQVPIENIIVSEKDNQQPNFKDLGDYF